MIIQEVMDLLKHFPKLKTDTGRRALLNQRTNDSWDFLRWFLAIHYKYNRKMESPFWNTCQNETNIWGVSDLIQLYREAGPLSYQNDALQELMQPFKEDIIFGPFGFDLMLMGQGVATGNRVKVVDAGKTWKNKRRIWLDLIRSALPQEQALEVLDRYPNMLGQ
jgi:tryptophan halogenase